MAINDPSLNVGNFDNAPQAQQPRMSNSFSFHGGSALSSPISRGVGSEFYNNLKNNLVEIYKQASEETEIALLDLDNINEPSLAFSSILVCLRLRKNPEVGVAYHILLLEATGPKLSPAFDTINGQQVELLKVTSDALDEVLVNKAQTKVQKAFPNAGRWTMVDGTVVPASFNASDKVAVHRLALNAGLATFTELNIHVPGFRDLNMSNLQHDSTLNVTISFGRNQVADAVGHPVRSDIVVDFVSKKNGQNRNASVNSGDKEVLISSLSGFVDLVWNPQNPGGFMNPWNQQQLAGMTQKYAARLVMTDVRTEFSCTPSSVLLALASSLALRDDSNWIQTFRPAPVHGNEIDMTDIGALNIEANLTNDPSGVGERIDTKNDSFKLEDLGRYAQALIQPGLITSLDCPEFGPQAWYLSMFAHASNGDTGAYAAIVKAANDLTNNAFMKYFPANAAMFVDTGNRIHMGYWMDRTGAKRDIRDIDHVAVCNLFGRNNPSNIRDWSDTFLRTQFPLAQRLAARKRMIQGLTNETAVFTGFAQRVTFSAAFMEALTKGLRETGMQVRVNTPLSTADFNNTRGVGSFASAALLAPGQSFAYAPGPGQAQFANYGMNMPGRW